MPSVWCVGGAMNGLNTVFDSHFLQEAAPRNLSEMNFLANPRSLLDVIEWLVGIQECFWSVIISFYHHIPSLWCGGEAMNGLNSLLDSHFLQEGVPRNVSEIKILANPRSLLDVIEWLAGIQECLECCNILLPSYTKPLMWWWSYEWPQLITWHTFFTRSCAQESVWDQEISC